MKVQEYVMKVFENVKKLSEAKIYKGFWHLFVGREYGEN